MLRSSRRTVRGVCGDGFVCITSILLNPDRRHRARSLLLGFVIAASLARWWQMWVAHDLAYRLLADIRVQLFDGLERRAPRYLLGRRSGDLATTVMSDVETIEWFYAHTIADYLVTVIISGGAVVAIAFFDPWLALALLLFLLLLATVPVWLARRAGRPTAR